MFNAKKLKIIFWVKFDGSSYKRKLFLHWPWYNCYLFFLF